MCDFDVTLRADREVYIFVPVTDVAFDGLLANFPNYKGGMLNIVSHCADRYLAALRASGLSYSLRKIAPQ